MFAHLNPHNSNFGDICASFSPFLHQLPIVCGTCKLRLCLSYSSDRINLVFFAVITGGGGERSLGQKRLALTIVHSRTTLLDVETVSRVLGDT